MNRDLRLLTEELEKSCVKYEIKNGARHLKIYVNGALAGILPRCSSSTTNKRALMNVRAQIRRAIRS